MNKTSNSKNTIFILVLFLFNFLLVINLITGSTQDPHENTNPIVSILEKTGYDVPANETESEKVKVTTTENYDIIVVSMECESCTVTLYIASDFYQNDIDSGMKKAYNVAEIYLEEQTSINNVSYQVPTKGDWWVVLENFYPKFSYQYVLEIQVTSSSGNIFDKINISGDITNTNTSSISLVNLKNLETGIILILTIGIVTIGFFGIKTLRNKNLTKKNNKIFFKTKKTIIKQLKHDSKIKNPWLIYILGPIITIITIIVYSTRYKNITVFEAKENPTRKKLISILEELEFDHFNSLQKRLNCGVSVLKWHLNVLENFDIISFDKIGQYNVIYLKRVLPSLKKISLYYSIQSSQAYKIIKLFSIKTTWKIKDIQFFLNFKVKTIKKYIIRLEELQIVKRKNDEYFLIPDQGDLIRWYIKRKKSDEF